eukprot:c23318_g1_i1 orf=119-1795(+)
MAGRPRRQVRTVIVERDSDSEESSEEEELESETDEDAEGGESDEERGMFPGAQQEVAKVEDRREKKRKPITISLKDAKLCKVCKGKDHQAGFVGSIYMDCPNKPCFLCKQPGHTTATCPHRVAMEYGVAPAPRRQSLGMIDFVHERQLGSHLHMLKLNPVIPNCVDCAIIKLHSRRVTYIEFHPTKDNLLISGDKKGQVGIWDFERVFEKTVYTDIHTCLVNAIRFHPTNHDAIYTSGSDGSVNCTDLETGVPDNILNLNPDGWNGPSTWRMMYGMDVNSRWGITLVSDNFGFLYQVDIRSKESIAKPMLIHKKGSKVVGLQCNPVDPDLFITCGNDHTARIWDLRYLDSSGYLAELMHPRVVNSAYFSPRTGNKILTTCQDNRIRVYDCIFNDLVEPSREIVHSHDFNRYLTCFRAEWDPKDTTESLAVIGRYISDDFNGIALHPIDFIDISTGQLVAEVFDKNITTISPVNKLHPRLDVLATGSSRSLFIWRPKEVIGEDEHDSEKAKNKVSIYTVQDHDDMKKLKGKKRSKGGDVDGDDDDDDEYFCKENKVKNK